MKKFAVLVVIVIVALGAAFYLSEKDSKPAVTNNLTSVPDDNQLLNNMQAAGLSPLSTEGTVVHVHQHIDIVINGKAEAIPADIGVGKSFISALHTHDGTGILHLESPDTRDYKLGQFFDEWGMQFNDSCVATFCADDSHKLIVAVNGTPVTDARNHVLKAHEEIEIWYGDKNQNPDLIKSYNFPEGL